MLANILNMSACTLFQSDNKLKDKRHSIIKFDASPSPARLYIQGKPFGTTPIELDLEVYQKQQYAITALPYNKHHFPQKVILSEGALPATVHFFMDIPTVKQDTNETSNQDDLACQHEPFLEQELLSLLYFSFFHFP